MFPKKHPRATFKERNEMQGRIDTLTTETFKLKRELQVEKEATATQGKLIARYEIIIHFLGGWVENLSKAKPAMGGMTGMNLNSIYGKYPSNASEVIAGYQAMRDEIKKP